MSSDTLANLVILAVCLVGLLFIEIITLTSPPRPVRF